MRSPFETEFKCINVKGRFCPINCPMASAASYLTEGIVLELPNKEAGDTFDMLELKVGQINPADDCPLEAQEKVGELRQN